ncbi:MAG: hypothetical protein VX346_20945 [Planctomycetota bacterium]|nr:hypothetical protein [Planctomycetota bacterium]
MHRLVFSLAVLMGTVLVAQIPEEIPLEPPANQPNEVVEPVTDSAIPDEKVEILNLGKPVNSIDERPPVPADEKNAAGELAEPDIPADEPVPANPNELVLPPKAERTEIASESNGNPAGTIELPKQVDAKPTQESRYERSLADRVVPQSNPRRDLVRLNAARRAARRRFRIATMKWLNYSKIRPAVGATPTTSYYTPSWRAFEVDTSAYWDEFGSGLPPSNDRSIE